MTEGSTLVDEAGKTMSDVAAAIQRVTDIMGRMTEASRAQSRGVSEVGAAINGMDQSTQQNAALVEESASAADSLRHQAVQLVAAVSVFKLSAELGAAVG